SRNNRPNTDAKLRAFTIFRYLGSTLRHPIGAAGKGRYCCHGLVHPMQAKQRRHRMSELAPTFIYSARLASSSSILAASCWTVGASIRATVGIETANMPSISMKMLAASRESMFLEIVGNAHAVGVQHVTPNFRELALGRATRRDVRAEPA